MTLLHISTLRQPAVAHTQAVEHRVNGCIRCSKCTRWLLPCEFESKGQRAGRQVRRKTCNDCRSFRKWALKPLATWDEDSERRCRYCGKTWAIAKFDKGGTYQGRQYRRWKCQVCCNAYQRARYRLMVYRQHGRDVRQWRRKPKCKRVCLGREDG